MRTADVLVIGGGLVGCAAACRLAEGGASVELVEASFPNAGASGANAGSLHFQIERRFLENGDALADQAAQILGLNRLAIEEWRGLEAELDADLHVHMRGGLMIASTRQEVALLEAKAEREARGGLGTRLIDGDEARRLAPALAPSVVAACYLDVEGHADARSVTPAFAARAASLGARMTFGARVTGARRVQTGYEVTVRSAGGDIVIRAGKVLIAAGAWSARVGELFNVHLPIYPVALLMSVTERVSPFLDQLIQHVGRRLSMKQSHAGNLLIGGGWPSRMRLEPSGRFDLDRPAEMIDASLSGNLAVAAEVMPRIAQMNLIRSWTGITAVTADQLPLVGAVPEAPGVYVAAGGSAFTLGPTFARLLARQMLDQPEDRLDIFAPARFGHLNSFMGMTGA